MARSIHYTTKGVFRNQQPRRKRRGCCSHKVVAVGFNTLCYDASVGVLNPPHESMTGLSTSILSLS